MFKFLSFRGGSSTRCRNISVLVLALTALLFSSFAQAQAGHGIALRKGCEGPVAVCQSDADCSDGNQCTDDLCDPGDQYLSALDCEITATYNDTYGDRITLTSVFDTIEATDGDVRNPATGSLPIVLVSGNTDCQVGGTLPCAIGPANNDFAESGTVVFQSTGYIPKANDPAILYDTGESFATDQCNGTTFDPLCPATPNALRALAPGQNAVVDGCENPFEPDSTPCDNDDGNACTTSGCDGAGTCDPLHNVVTCDAPGVCEDDNVCNTTSGICEPVYSADSTPCDNDDGNACTTSGCDGAGTCDPLHNVVTCDAPGVCEDDNVCNTTSGICEPVYSADSTPCDNDDGNACTTSGCDGAGTCDPLHNVVTCDAPGVCEDDNVCNTTSGICEPVYSADSTPCDNDDGNACTTSGCDGAGTCDPLHNVVTCDAPGVCEDDNVCNTTSGICEPVYSADSTPCDNDDGNACTTSGCDGAGTCDPLHNVVTCDAPGVCEDDNVCNTTSGICEPVYSADSTPCDNEDGNACTESGCDGAGTCDPAHIDLPCGAEVCRTPGFWGARGGEEKGDNITLAVIGDGLEVCGQMITNTDLEDPESAIEAICINKGDPRAKMMRMLTAASLNCSLSNCGTNTLALIADCNDVCFDNDDSLAISLCQSALGCFNEGGHINDDGSCVAAGTGVCSGDSPNAGETCGDDEDCIAFGVGSCIMYDSCHDRSLCEPDSNFCFEPPGPASSPKKCNTARKNGGYIWDFQ